ncbi:MAG: hypothetical protein RLZZ200_2629 [Pseudomonadota bacterium]
MAVTVVRPRRLPKLAKLAKGAEPAEFLAGVLGRHATYPDAAAELGVSLATLRKWRKEFGIEVRTA